MDTNRSSFHSSTDIDKTPHSTRSNCSNTLVVPSSVPRSSQSTSQYSLSGSLNRHSMIIAPNPYKDQPRPSITPVVNVNIGALQFQRNSCKDHLPPMINVNSLSPIAIAQSLGSPSVQTPQTTPRSDHEHVIRRGTMSSKAFRSIAGIPVS